jgi:hypothetical protein
MLVRTYGVVSSFSIPRPVCVRAELSIDLSLAVLASTIPGGWVCGLAIDKRIYRLADVD